MFTIIEILDLATRIERNAGRVYRKAIASVSDPALASLLAWMAGEEECHAEWFQKLSTDVSCLETNSIAESFGGEMLGDLIDEKNFTLKDIDFSAVESAEELIDIFMDFEKDSILFYEILQGFVQDKCTRDQLDRIISEERHHIERLQALLHDVQAADPSLSTLKAAAVTDRSLES